MKAKNIISIFTNIAMMAVAAVGVVFTLFSYETLRILDLVRNFALLTNTALVVVSLFGLIRNIVSLAKKDDRPCAIYKFLRLMVTTALILNCVLSLFFIEGSLTDWHNILIRLVAPGLALLHYVFIESDHKHNFAITLAGIVLPVVYLGYMIPLCNFTDLPVFNAFLTKHPLLDVVGAKANEHILIMALGIVGTYIVGCVLYLLTYLLNVTMYKNCSKHLTEIVDEIPEVDEPVEETPVEVASEPVVEEEVKEQPAPKAKKTSTTKAKTTTKTKTTSTEKKTSAPKKDKEETPSAPSKTKKKKEETPVAEVPSEEEVKNTAPEYRIYHVSKRASDGRWQVKFAKGQRAIKLFRTQAEAIEFAKKLAESQNGSYRVHSVSGKIRKG